jgi:hypothetical protein
MTKKTYTKVNQSTLTTAQVNMTYNGKEIPSGITTTDGEYLQSEQSLKTSNSEAMPESKTPEFKYLNQFHKESTERTLKKIEEWSKSPLPSEIAIAQMQKNSKDY